MQAPFLLRLRKAFSNKKGFLQRVLDKGSFFRRGALSNKNRGFTERFLDAGPLFTKAKAFSNKKGFLQRFPDKGSFFTWGGPQQQEQKLRRELP